MTEKKTGISQDKDDIGKEDKQDEKNDKDKEEKIGDIAKQDEKDDKDKEDKIDDKDKQDEKDDNNQKKKNDEKDNKNEEDNKNNKNKKSIKDIIFTKLTSDDFKKKCIHHLAPVLFFFLFSIFVYRNLFTHDGEIINGDLVRPPELERYFHWFYPMWVEYESFTVLSRLPQLLFLLPFFGIGFMFGMETNEVLLMLFIFVETLAGISMFYASRYLLKKTYLKNKNNQKIEQLITIASFMTGLTYMCAPYMIYHSLHPFIRIAFAFAPLLILTIIKCLETKKLRYMILTGFLWSMICGDVHWIVYGALIILGLMLFYFILDMIKPSREKKWKKLKRSLTFHIGGVFVLFGSFLCFSAYWFVPGLFMGGTSRFSITITNDYLQNWYSQATFINILKKQASFSDQSVMFNTDIDILNSPATQGFIILLAFVLLMLGILAMVLKPKNRYVVFFSVLAVFSLFLTTCVYFIPEIGLWIINDAPLHGLYGWSIRTPKFSQFVMLSLCFLMAFSIMEIMIRIDKSKFKNIKIRKGLVGLFIIFLAISIIFPSWPLVTGDINGTIRPSPMPDEFSQANSWLDEQEGDFKVLWIPKYFGRDITWNEGRRTKMDIAGFTSSKPTYVIDSPHRQPERYGIYYLSSIFSDDHQFSLLFNNLTSNVGKFLTPIGVKYVIYHDDNTRMKERNSIFINNLKAQDDLELVQRFGFIYIFENIDYSKSARRYVYTSSENLYVSGGMSSLATLNSVPYFDMASNGVVFANQDFFEKEELDNVIDKLVLTQYTNVDEIALSFVDDKYLIIPYEKCHEYEPSRVWSKDLISDLTLTSMKSARRGDLAAWDWDYAYGVVFTWSPGTLNEDATVTKNDMLTKLDFEDDLGGFNTSSTLVNLSLSPEAAEGNASLSGMVLQAVAEPAVMQMSNTELKTLPVGSNFYRVNFKFAIKYAINAQVILKYFDENKRPLGQHYFLSEWGTFDFKEFEADINFPLNTKYYSIQVLVDQSVSSESYWWLDDFRIYDLYEILEPNKMDMNFDVDSSGEYDIFFRYLKNIGGGKINVYLDGKFVRYLDSYQKPSAFVWELIDTYFLNKGSHTLTIENVNGFNALNLLAVIPGEKSSEYFDLAEEFISDREIIYLLEAESNQFYDKVKVSESYGNLASMGSTLKFNPGSEAWSNIEILRPGNYTMMLRGNLGDRDNILKITFGNYSRELQCPGANNSELSWFSLPGFELLKGNYELEYYSSSDLTNYTIASFSFEGGWDPIEDVPAGWEPSLRDYSAVMDNDFSTHGEYSLKVTTNSTDSFNNARLVSQNITIVPNTNYEVSIDIKIENVNNSQVKLIGFNKSSGDWDRLYSLTPSLRGTKYWRSYNHTIHLSENFTDIKVIFYPGNILNSSEGNATIWFDDLRILPVIEQKDMELDMAILYLDENNRTLAEFFEPSNTAEILDYKKTDITHHEIKISSSEPFILCLSENYDQFWIARISGEGEIESKPFNGMLNGFIIDKTGNFTVIIEYSPQKWFDIGMSITGISIIGTLAIFIWIERRTWGGKLRRLFGKQEKLARIAEDRKNTTGKQKTEQKIEQKTQKKTKQKTKQKTDQPPQTISHKIKKNKKQ